MSIKVVRPSCGGWLEKKLSKEEMTYLWGVLDEETTDAKDDLAGIISKSTYLVDRDDWFWNNTLLDLCLTYGAEVYNIGEDYPTSERLPYYLEKFWCNYQYQTEFNPPHNHSGVYSFVVWMKVPTDYKEQMKLPIARSSATSSVVSNFEFSYVDILGHPRNYIYSMDPSKEGTIIFFPSKLGHAVYPFYNCDEERISLSGNIALKVPEE